MAQELNAPPYKFVVGDDFIVRVYRFEDLIDWPGPWGDLEGAVTWAELMVARLQEGDDPYGNEEKA